MKEMESQEFFNFKSAAIEVAVSSLANWGMIINGMVLGFPSAVVPPLLSNGPGLHSSVDQASWEAGLPFLSASLGSILAGPLIDKLGRRRGLMLLNLIFAVGWFLLAIFPLSLTWLYIGRLLTGLGLGLSACVAVTYTAEVASSRLRTMLVTLTPLMMSLGTILVYLGSLVYQDSWTEVSYLALVLSGFSTLLTPLLPESPLWLLNKGHDEEALSTLMTLRGAKSSNLICKEYQRLQAVHGADAKKIPSSWKADFRLLCRPEAFKPLFIMNMFFLFQQMAGVGIVIQFAGDFVRAAGVEAQACLLALVISIIRTISALLTTWVCNRFGRRGPALWSGVFLSLSLLALAILPLCNFSSTALACVFLLLYVFFTSIGFFALPWSMLGEIFPTNIRGVASGLTVLMIYLVSFVAAKLYTVVIHCVNPCYEFLFFGISGLLGTLFLYIFLPETHGKTLEEIEDYFKGKKNCDQKYTTNIMS